MARLARITPAVAVACPHCRARLSELPLDDLTQGVSYPCPECGEVLRMPKAVLDRLLAQRDALAEEYPEDAPVLPFWRRWWDRLVFWWSS